MKMRVDETNWIAAAPLKDAQPLAYLLLQMVQVRCPKNNSANGNGNKSSDDPIEYYIGNYGDLPAHLLLENDRYADSPVLLATSKPKAMTTTFSNNTPSTSTPTSATGSTPPLGPRKSIEKEGHPTLYDAGVGHEERTSIGITTRGTGAHHKRMVDASVVLKKFPPVSSGVTSVGAAEGSAGAIGFSDPNNTNLDGIDVVPDYDYDPEELMRAMERCDKLKKTSECEIQSCRCRGGKSFVQRGAGFAFGFPLGCKVRRG